MPCAGRHGGEVSADRTAKIGNAHMITNWVPAAAGLHRRMQIGISASRAVIARSSVTITKAMRMPVSVHRDGMLAKPHAAALAPPTAMRKAFLYPSAWVTLPANSTV